MSWLTTGVVYNDIGKDKWVDVREEAATVKSQLDIDREFSFQIGLYSRIRSTLSRYLSLDETNKSALRSLLSLVYRIHQVRQLTLWARISPGPGEKADLWTPIETQVNFLAAVVPRGTPLKVHCANLVSAYLDSAIEGICGLFDGTSTATTKRCCFPPHSTLSSGRTACWMSYKPPFEVTIALACHWCGAQNHTLFFRGSTGIGTRCSQGSWYARCLEHHCNPAAKMWKQLGMPVMQPSGSIMNSRALAKYTLIGICVVLRSSWFPLVFPSSEAKSKIHPNSLTPRNALLPVGHKG
jgi:hypothetical protein